MTFAVAISRFDAYRDVREGETISVVLLDAKKVALLRSCSFQVDIFFDENSLKDNW